MKKLFFSVMALFIIVSVCGQTSKSQAPPGKASSEVRDIDGNLYNTITIGQQIWLDRNLQTTRYNDGTPIPNMISDSAWTGIKFGACCFYRNDSVSFKNTYGALYNWYAVVDKRNLCPAGWHPSAEKDWNTLAAYLGGGKGNGGKLKNAGFEHWISPNTGATNKSGFSALPGGIRYFAGAFPYLGGYGYWWTATECPNNLALSATLFANNANLVISSSDKGNGYSVRCVKD